jgi:hypothetical protein
MVVVEEAAPGESFDTRRVLGRVLAMLRAHWLALGLVSLVIVAPAIIASNWLTDRISDATLSPNRLLDSLEKLAGTTLATIVLIAIEACVTAWVALILIGDETAAVRSVGAPSLAGEVAARAGAIVIQSALLVLGIVAASCLLLVPGILLTLAWIVATPALAAEGLSPRRALARSRELTRGHRGPIFGLILAWYLPVTLLDMVIAKAITGEAHIKQAYAAAPIHFGFLPLMGSLSHMVAAALVASLYVELVTIKEGGLVSSVGEVFA